MILFSMEIKVWRSSSDNADIIALSAFSLFVLL